MPSRGGCSADQFGNMVTFDLHGGRDTVNRFMQRARLDPVRADAGRRATIISHPAVTSHRGLTAEAREALGISEGTVRVSVGVEDLPLLVEEFRAALG